MSTPDDLAQTVREVEALDRRIVATQADVRDYGAVKAALDAGVAELGRLDIVAANAGISSVGRAEELPEQTWQDMIDINLTGVWHAAKAAIPHLKAGGRGGSIIITSSAAGLMAMENIGHYVTAKHGLVGLMRTLALELARWGTTDAALLDWLDAPPPPALQQARGLLTRLGALDERQRLNARGQQMARLPVHPRLAAMLLAARDSAARHSVALAAQLAPAYGTVLLVAAAWVRQPK